MCSLMTTWYQQLWMWLQVGLKNKATCTDLKFKINIY